LTVYAFSTFRASGGRHDFHPDPKEVLQFDVIFTLLAELHRGGEAGGIEDAMLAA
jgi:hypothetical protein